MKRKIFSALLSLAAIAGIAIAENEPLDLKVNDSKRKQEKNDSIANSFDNFALSEGISIRGRLEKRFIKRGDSVRIRYVFDRSVIEMISSRYLGLEIPYECLKKGEWIITLAPESTQWVDFHPKAFAEKRPMPEGFLIIVVEPEKYDDIKRQYDKVKDDFKKSSDFIDKLAKQYGGKTAVEYFDEELKRWGR
jgi:hypothetical protein